MSIAAHSLIHSNRVHKLIPKNKIDMCNICALIIYHTPLSMPNAAKLLLLIFLM